MTALTLRQQSRAEADARRWLGKGQILRFYHDNQPGELRIKLSNKGAADLRWPCFSCSAGMLALSDFAPLFSLLSECPALNGDSDDDGEWYWELFNQSLFSDIASLFGTIRPLAATDTPSVTLCLQLQVTFAGQQARSLLCLTPETLNTLSAHPGWQPHKTALIETLPLTLPLVMATFSLPLEDIIQLQAGDVLRAPSAHFGVDGDGVINIGHLALYGALQPSPDSPHNACFSIYDIKELTMSYPNDPLLPADEENPYPHVNETDDYEQNELYDSGDGEQLNEILDEESPYPHADDMHDDYGQDEQHEIAGASALNEALSALPLELSVRCGQLRLTLGELQQLDIGSTVVVDNVKPGAAILCHGSFPIAKGELVNVDGHLGLQLTNIINNRPVGTGEGV